MADRSSKAPKKEGTLESSAPKRSQKIAIKSRSPIITRSQSKNRHNALSFENSASNRLLKRVKALSSSESNKIKIKKSRKDIPLISSSSPNQNLRNNSLIRSFSNTEHSKETEKILKKEKKNPIKVEKPSILIAKKKEKFEKVKDQIESNHQFLANTIEKNLNLSDINSAVMDQNGSSYSSNNSTNSSNGGNSSNQSSQINPSSSNILNNFVVESQNENDIDEADMNRLQNILESRALHTHFLGLPRMQNFFYRSFNNSSNTKAQQLLNSLNSSTNDSEKLHYVLEMCQLLLMGNEDTLVGFPIKSVVPTLINLLSMEHNFEIMHHACRALTYMMEALPRSSIAVLDAIPVFLEKLQAIQCMDVAEQSLSALEMLSRRHNRSILQARGVSACLTFLDFFSIDAQRSALTVTANCFQNLSLDEFQYVQDSLTILSSHLTIEDKKCIESICLAFYRLVECYQNDCAIISEIASTELLSNIQNVLMASPPILSTGSFVNVIRMLFIMCLSCSRIAVDLLKLNICETLRCLLLSNNVKDESDAINLISRNSQEISELASFIAELMPSLPINGIFVVDSLFSKTSSELPVWQWKDDRGLWQTFNGVDNKIIESAHQSGEDDLELASLNRTYIVDFNSMRKLCEDTGLSYAIQRKANHFSNSELLSRSNIQVIDPRSEFINKELEISSNFIKLVFKVLNEVYNNSAGHSVRYKCLNAILRILFYSPKELLYLILKDQSVSSSIATMLASQDFRTVVCATQMCNILMEKMPEVFSIYFQREGVIHQIRKLYSDETRFNDKLKSSNGKISNNSAIFSTTSKIYDSAAQVLLSQNNDSFLPIEYLTSNNDSHTSKSVPKLINNGESIHLRNEEIFKRKRTRKSTNFSGNSVRNSSINDISNNAENTNDNDLTICNNLQTTYLNTFPFIVNETSPNNNLSKGSTKINTKDFLQKLNPTRWARWTQNSVHSSSVVSPTTSNVSVKDLSVQKSNANKEKIKIWIKEQAKVFDEKYFSNFKEDININVSSNILKDLTKAISLLKENWEKALKDIKNILLDSDISSFELIHSGLVEKLLSFLVSSDSCQDIRDKKIKTFLHVFFGTTLNEFDNFDESSINNRPLSILVSKLNACISQLEQFPLRVHDYTNSSTTSRTSSTFKLLSSHFLKISLCRHPSCTNLKKYNGPLIKLDPFTPVQSIERFLLSKGYGKIKEEDDQSEDDVSDDDSLDLNYASNVQTSSRQRIQLMIGDYVLPYNLSLYQAIKQYMNNEVENESDESQFLSSKLGSATFLVHYKLATDSIVNASSPAACSSNRNSRRNKNKVLNKKRDELWLNGKLPKWFSPLSPYLQTALSINANISDQCLEVICLLRVLYGIVRYWGYLFKLPNIYNPAIPLKEFINYKLTVKANRQLQDPLVIMTGTWPAWLTELAYACPFMFPFDTRHLLFYITCFDRERAFQRLFENIPDLSTFDSRERLFVPRLEKKKKIVSRNDIFKSAESLFSDTASSKSLLEIQYENEVGTGLGPTLEFYALVSVEFQRSDLEMWRGQTLSSNVLFKNETFVKYVYSNNGLFPLPLGRNTKVSFINKTKQRFKLLGRFMAKALMDSRMIDINLNILFYQWLLNQESTFTVSDLYHLDSTFFSSFIEMYKIAQKKTKKNGYENADNLKLNGCSIEDLELDFTLPGYANIELRKNGRDTQVTLNNLENYVDLVTYWSLIEGVSKQFESFKEGFNSILDLSLLKLFYAEELSQLFGGFSFTKWDIKMLMESCKTDHGFTHESRAIKFLFEILSSYNDEEQRKFLQFLTGSPRLPIGGFKSLVPPFTIVKKSNTELDNPSCLPSVMTCVNYLKLPDYPTIEIMRGKLDIAINEGQFSFHLS